MTLLYILGSRLVLSLFLNDSSREAAATGVRFLRTLAPFYMVISMKLIADGILRGAGLMKKFMVATFVDLVLRVVLALILSRTALGEMGIWLSWPIGWSIATVISYGYYRSGRWKRMWQLHNQPAK